MLLIVCRASGASAKPGAQSTQPAIEAGQGFLVDVFSHRDTRRRQIDLSGQWEFRRESGDAAADRAWLTGEGAPQQSIRVPGAPQAQGIGEPNTRQKHFFDGPFQVRRQFRAPPLTERERLWLRIGGILPAAEIHINGRYVGYTKSSRTQQRVDVTPFVTPGDDNLLAIRVCEYPKVRLDGIWEMAECARNWTGVYGPIACEVTDRVCVIDAYVQPHLASRSARVTATLSQAPGEPLRLIATVKSDGKSLGETAVALAAGQCEARLDVTLDQFTPWSPQSPQLYDLELALIAGDAAHALDHVGIRFGMREIAAKGTKFYLNGQPLYVRAFGENQYYPETLCPPADKDWYLPRLKRARAYGMNAVKGCVEALPQAYIEAADEAGIMIIQEMPFGLSELRANRYTIGSEFRAYYAAELDGLVRESRNHASVIAYSMSSEMEFPNQTQESFNFFSRDLVQQTRRLAPHALVIDCTGYLNGEETQKGKRDTDFYASIIPTWMKEVLDETPIITDRKHPTILHEYNWWSCYPDPASRDRYAACQLQPFWLDTLLKTARANGQEDLLPTYRGNSLRLQALCRKDGIEYARRCPDVEGYILWLLIDFGQYCEGLLDDFWDPKNVSPQEFLQSNGDTVILLAREGNRCLTAGSRPKIPLAVSHYGPAALRGCTLSWRLSGLSPSQDGELPIEELPQGRLTPAGDVLIDLTGVEKACKLDLHVTLRHESQTINTNQWSFWAFPEVEPRWHDLSKAADDGPLWPDGTCVRLSRTSAAPIAPSTLSVTPIRPSATLVITNFVDQPLVDYLERGGRCLLLSRGAAIENTAVYYGSTSFYKTFRTIPWNAGTSGNSGSVIASPGVGGSDPAALADFPHEGFCDLPFVWLIRDVLPMEFEPLRPCGVTPIIRMIDHYAANRNNAHLLEFRVGSGSVLATTLNILPQTTRRIEARYLLRCLADYARSDAFRPSASVPPADFLKWFTPRPSAPQTAPATGPS